jgi:hypothetical protein
MKPFPLLPQVALVFAIAYACTDSTAPANSHALMTPGNPAPVLGAGDPPPPPVDVAVTFTISSHTFSGPFTGVYFSNGDQSLPFSGTAWLRLDNRQADVLGTSASANARFKVTDDKFSGHGTLVIDGHVVVITEVTSFFANPDCGVPGEVCAVVTFNATVDGESGHTGTAEAFDRETCTLIEGEGDPVFDCGEGGC